MQKWGKTRGTTRKLGGRWQKMGRTICDFHGDFDDASASTVPTHQDLLPGNQANDPGEGWQNLIIPIEKLQKLRAEAPF